LLLPAKCWLVANGVYEFRQAIELEWRGRRESFEAVMRFEPAAGRLYQVLFSPLGTALLKLRVARRDYRAAGALAESFAGRRLARLLAGAWQRIFLDLRREESGGVSLSGQTPRWVSNPPRLVALTGECGRIEYDDFRLLGEGDGELAVPMRIKLHNLNPAYDLSLRFLTLKRVAAQKGGEERDGFGDS
jgi:hypothetical protein